LKQGAIGKKENCPEEGIARGLGGASKKKKPTTKKIGREERGG